MKVKDLLISRYSKYGNSFIITSNRELICFSKENDDLITKFKFPLFTDKPILIELTDKFIGNERIESVLNDFKSLTTQISINEFLFNRSYLEPIHDTIRLGNTTHIRFFSKDGSIFIRTFDYRKFVYEVTYNDDGYYETQLTGESTSTDFSFTLESTSLLKLTKNNYQVEILEDGIIGFISMNDDVEFYFRNQDIQEPIIEFQHETLKKQISLIKNY